MQHPSFYNPNLTQERLIIIAHKIQEQVDLTYDTNSTIFDSAYTQGCTIFGRVRDLLHTLAQGTEFDWIKLVKAGNAVVIDMAGAAFRFATDDPDKPRKSWIMVQSLLAIVLYKRNFL